MTNKLKYFVANWKMFGDLTSLKKFNRDLLNPSFLNRFRKRNKFILCIPNTLIYLSKKIFKPKLISIGAQNCHYEEKYGPHTGFVSPYMLKNSGAEYVILGHSENRLNGETDKIIRKKIEAALNQNLKVILCIGESYKQKLKKKTFFIIRQQIKNCLPKKINSKNLFIAYEPIWSIGTGKTPKVDELNKIFKFIKEEVSKTLKTKSFAFVFYGGSVNSKNIRNFSTTSIIDGFLIGGASKTAKNFIDIIKNYYK